MQDLRDKIDIIDEKILILLRDRFDLCKSIGHLKMKENKPVIYDPVREKEVVNNLKTKNILDNILIDEIWNLILYLSRCIQKDIIAKKNP